MNSKKTGLILSLCVGLAVSGNIIVFSVTALVALQIAPSPVWATFPIVMQYVASTLVSLPASMIMGKFGRKVGFSVALFVAGFGGLTSAYAIIDQNFLLFNIGAMLIGVLGGFAPYYRFAAVDAAPPEETGKIISMVMAGGVIAAIAGPVLAQVSRNWFAVEFIGSFVVLTILPLIGLLLMSQTEMPKLPLHKSKGRSFKELSREPKFILALAAGMVSYGVMSLLMVSTPLAMSHRHLGFSSITDVIQWHVLAMFIPSFFTGKLIKRWGVYPLLLVGILLYLVALGINFTGEDLIQFWSSMILVGLGWNFLYLGASKLLTETYQPNEMIKVQGLNETSILAVIAASSLGSGYLVNHVGWQGVNIAALPMAGLVLVMVLWLLSVEKRVAV